MLLLFGENERYVLRLVGCCYCSGGGSTMHSKQFWYTIIILVIVLVSTIASTVAVMVIHIVMIIDTNSRNFVDDDDDNDDDDDGGVNGVSDDNLFWGVIGIVVVFEVIAANEKHPTEMFLIRSDDLVDLRCDDFKLQRRIS